MSSIDAGAFFSASRAVAQSLAVLETHSLISPIHIYYLLTGPVSHIAHELPVLHLSISHPAHDVCPKPSAQLQAQSQPDMLPLSTSS